MASKFERLHGTITGSGPTTVLLGHGFGTDQTAWAGVRGWLDRHFRVVSYDMAGAGPDGEANYDPRRHASLFGYADDLLEVGDELGLEQCIYIGHSVGSMLGVAAGLARPRLFRRLLLIGASPRYLNAADYEGGFEQAELDTLYGGMAANFQAWAAGFVPMVVGVSGHAALHEFSRMLFQMRPDIALMIARTIFQSDLRSVASRTQLPCHIVQTRHDMAVPMSVADWLHQHLRESTLDVIDAEGHVPHMTAPQEVLRIFAKYLLPPAAVS